MKKLIIIIHFNFICLFIFSQNNIDSIKTYKEQIKKGWNLGALPLLAYDADLGFRYGALLSLYHYGDGSHYPLYKHFFYLDGSRSTKGNRAIVFAYDSRFLIPSVLTSVNIQYLTEKALDFYGFNGYNALYENAFEQKDNPQYKSRMYFRLERKLIYILTDFQKDLQKKQFKIIAGFNFYDNAIGSVDISNLNKGKNKEDLLPTTDSVPGLYENYVDWEIIKEKEKNGGKTAIFKGGLTYDTRDNEPNPMNGLWSEAMLIYAPELGKNYISYTQIAVTHRQYFTIKKELINLACRFYYQSKISGNMPFYMLPFVQAAGKPTRDGLGGAKTMRGIIRNRLVGEGMAYTNIETRWKFFRKNIAGQNFYSALSVFYDAGIITKKYQYCPK